MHGIAFVHRTDVSNMSTPENAFYISPEQLCVGLFVHLDLSWMDHPFTFSSFKIKNAEQIDTIRRLKLQRIRYEPGKSDVKPAPAPVAPVAQVAQEPQAEAVVPPEPVMDDELVNEKKQRIEQLNRIKNELHEVERKFQEAASAVKNISRNIHSKPKEAYTAADTLVGKMVEAMINNGDVMVHAMNDKLGDDVYFHSLNVTVLSLMLAKVLGLDAEQVHQLGMGAMFHDIGKTEIPQKILMKTDPLTKAEQSFLEMHCEYGVKIANKIGLSREAMTVVMQHHEFSDGSGYPNRITGDKMTLLSRIVSIVNAYDNLCNPSVLANSLTPHEALSQMFAVKRGKFDEAPLKAFIRCMGVYPPGSIVQLSNDMFGLVVSVNPSKPLKPNILVYDPEIPKEEAVIINLERETEINIARSLRPNQLSREVYQYLSPRKHVTYFFDPSQQVDSR